MTSRGQNLPYSYSYASPSPSPSTSSVASKPLTALAQPFSFRSRVAWLLAAGRKNTKLEEFLGSISMQFRSAEIIGQRREYFDK